ncbi:ATP phosphoribosyltransferase regulatory subunit [Chlorogloea sp. CCALA 695]|uniref:ATP phosphoribosyltransferase regulatory subunit n=1 Tax=Chlorogloea sp. CCALA 695 TaxID=2107693 RepID=UPI000D06EAE2|nr:ATP phosphoribosyltransferase regulatory subunit [Chlorogloea sp. CCALA 695]PSB31130.1 ATP phosphoribosyltransferase regulatory subunit [Chlorogloea sp. CCALA 695]
MIYQPPTGARDLLPLDVTQKHWIEERLQQVFQRYGYHQIITSTLERLDTLMAGGAIERRSVIQLQGLEEELGLRPELTASIARAAVTRMAGVTHGQRLYYIANVFRRTKGSSHNRVQEFYQAGVELLGGGGGLADAEILLLVAECLQELGLASGWRLILGEAGIARSLLSPFPVSLQATVRKAIASLDRVTLENLPLSDALKARSLLLLDLRGKPADVLERVASLDLDESQIEAVHHLKSLISLLDQCYEGANSQFPLILDLSLVQTLDYYTGIVFEVVSDRNQTHVLGQGGRYDRLLGLYHPQGESSPGIGFALNIEQLQQVLLDSNQLPKFTPASNWLVVPENPDAYFAAFSYAQKLRSSHHHVQVEMELEGRNSDTIREYARSQRIGQIAWIKAGDKPTIESLNVRPITPVEI